MEDQPIGSIYLLDAGVVMLSRQAHGVDILLGYRSAGAAPGVCGAVSGRPYAVTTRTVGAVRVRPVSAASYRAAWEWSAAVREWALRVLAADVDDQTRWSAALASGLAASRLEAALGELFRTGSEPTPDGGRRLVLPDTIEHLALLVRVTREHATRLMTQLVRAGLIRRDGRRCLVAPASSPLLCSLQAKVRATRSPGDEISHGM